MKAEALLVIGKVFLVVGAAGVGGFLGGPAVAAGISGMLAMASGASFIILSIAKS